MKVRLLVLLMVSIVRVHPDTKRELAEGSAITSDYWKLLEE